MVEWFDPTPLVGLAQKLVQIRSVSGAEEEIVRFLEHTMRDLGYDEVVVDGMGNLLGRIGDGEKSILFDAHIDTVAVADEARWSVPPFSGEIRDGILYGRGAADMKSAAAAAIYAAVAARDAGLLAGKSVYVSCTVLEEDCDGENLKHLFQELGLRPDVVVICEPSENRIALGHKGKAQVAIQTKGISAHGAAPQEGVNAVYAMAEVIQRVERLSSELQKKPTPHGTLALTRIRSDSASLNAVPSECEIYLDRRLAPGETIAQVETELAGLIEGVDASCQVGTVHRQSWTGMMIAYQPLHAPWQIARDHPLAQACTAAYCDTFGRAPEDFAYWDFSTNAVTPVSMGIPTIGFGPGDPKQAHMLDEHCPVEQIVDARRFYTRLIGRIGHG